MFMPDGEETLLALQLIKFSRIDKLVLPTRPQIKIYFNSNAVVIFRNSRAVKTFAKLSIFFIYKIHAFERMLKENPECIRVNFNIKKKKKELRDQRRRIKNEQSVSWPRWNFKDRLMEDNDSIPRRAFSRCCCCCFT